MRERDAELAVDVLHEARAVEALLWRGAAPDVGNAEVLQREVRGRTPDRPGEPRRSARALPASARSARTDFNRSEAGAAPGGQGVQPRRPCAASPQARLLDRAARRRGRCARAAAARYRAAAAAAPGRRARRGRARRCGARPAQGRSGGCASTWAARPAGGSATGPVAGAQPDHGRQRPFGAPAAAGGRWRRSAGLSRRSSRELGLRAGASGSGSAARRSGVEPAAARGADGAGSDGSGADAAGVRRPARAAACAPARGRPRVRRPTLRLAAAAPARRTEASGTTRRDGLRAAARDMPSLIGSGAAAAGAPSGGGSRRGYDPRRVEGPTTTTRTTSRPHRGAAAPLPPPACSTARVISVVFVLFIESRRRRRRRARPGEVFLSTLWFLMLHALLLPAGALLGRPLARQVGVRAAGGEPRRRPAGPVPHPHPHPAAARRLPAGSLPRRLLVCWLDRRASGSATWRPARWSSRAAPERPACGRPCAARPSPRAGQQGGRSRDARVVVAGASTSISACTDQRSVPRTPGPCAAAESAGSVDPNGSMACAE